jgi:hypothetical protein
MYIAYSALRQQPTAVAQLTETSQTESLNPELQLRYEAYQNVCNKYRREIADIQKFLPGWQPEFYY